MEAIITGTGVPHPLHPKRAGAGVLVRTDAGVLQFDTGRNTVLRLAEAGQPVADVDAIFFTHHHYDHMVGFADLYTTRWQTLLHQEAEPLVIVAPRGPIRTVVEKTYESLGPDILQRIHVLGISEPTYDLREFNAPATPEVVFEGSNTTVEAVRVPHGRVEPSVAYRISSGGKTLVISGDCNKTEAIVDLATGADVLVHEAVCWPLIEGTYLEPVLHSHTECTDVGDVAARSGVPRLVVTHLIPSPRSEEDRRCFAERVREGGFAGELVIADDLHHIVM